VGLATGWRGSQVVAKRASLPFVFDWPNAWLTLGVAATMNFCFALLPAARAARVSPIRALKYE
jgi:ABC-type antimicrobial peptide transport system permease subunit